MNQELWLHIQDFLDYKISNFGRVYNVRLDKIMCTSVNNYGHVKITLKSTWSDERFTRSVAVMVAEAFVESPNSLCDYVVILDGDLSNVRADNLSWRPRWYAWKYTHQLKDVQPIHYKNLMVRNVTTGLCYNSIIDAGMREGLLFEDIWRSTYTGVELFPYGFVFEIVKRV